MNKKNDVLKLLIDDRQQFKSISHFSDKAGIYAVFFFGKNFPLDKEISEEEIIYIGKTESSQQSRDTDTHFKSGKTGSSTLRKSLGALLREKLDLVPRPRNEVDYKNGRYSQFIFDSESEEKLTSWMVDNLGLSFYEYDKSKKEIDSLESELISLQVPILNLQKNASNPFKSEIKKLRKDCADIARENFTSKVTMDKTHTNIKTDLSSLSDLGAGVENDKPDEKLATDVKIEATDSSHESGSGVKAKENNKSSGEYIDLWRSNRDRIINTIERTKWGPKQLQLNKTDFEDVGDRSSYTFSLELNKMEVSNDISGSPVARDLYKVLSSSATVVKLLATGNFIINMNNAFVLKVSKK